MDALPTDLREPFRFATRLGCPVCRSPLAPGHARLHCTGQHDGPSSFPIVDGFADLVVGERFEDETDDVLMQSEEQNTTHTVMQYWAPLFRRIAPGRDRLKVLAVGCGAGLEVDLLRAEAFDCVGIDNGNRTRAWSRRASGDALAMANAMRLPFEDGQFDVAFCGCVFPHVGVSGDSADTTERCWADRLAVAREMTRVVKPGGSILVSSPNRWFPLDLFHGREIGSYRTPLNPPWRRFLLSRSDYARLFREAGCAGPVRAQSIRDYWGFCRTGKSWKGRLLAVPVRALLAIGASAMTRLLRTSALVPWIVVRIER